MRTPSPGRSAATIWAATRGGLVALVILIAALAGIPGETHPWRDGRWWLDRFSYFDSYHFVRIATEGYFTPARSCCDQAYFPGYPLAMRAAAPALSGPTLAGWILALVAGVLAAVAFSGVARQSLSAPRAQRRALWLLALAPAGVFTVAVYSESLFLAAALGAWWAGLKQRWWLAGLGAALAVSTRVTGIFLVLGLLVMYAVSLRQSRRWPGLQVLWPLLPALALGGWLAWLRLRTGSWDAYREAQAIGWKRSTMAPWDALVHQFGQISGAGDNWLQVSRSIDLLAVVGGVVLTVIVLARHRWAEAAYLIPSVGVILTGSVWESAPRYALAWFPAYLILAEAAERRRWLWWLTVGISLLLGAYMVYGWATRRWVA